MYSGMRHGRGALIVRLSDDSDWAEDQVTYLLHEIRSQTDRIFLMVSDLRDESR